MGKDKKWMEKHGPHGVLSCSRGLCGEYDGGSTKPEKSENI